MHFIHELVRMTGISDKCSVQDQLSDQPTNGMVRRLIPLFERGSWWQLLTRRIM